MCTNGVAVGSEETRAFELSPAKRGIGVRVEVGKGRNVSVAVGVESV
jgi:hypothetical protein